MVVIGIPARIFGFIVIGLLVQGCFAQRSSPPILANGRSVTGIASWYGPGFNGRRTSSGSIYNQDELSAASTIFPLGTQLVVTNLANGRSVEVMVNDHGPYVDGRDLDLSHRAALVLGIVKPGTARVRMDVLSTPPGGPPLGPRYFVQVGSFTDPANARRVGEQLGRYYDDVRIIEATFEANHYYRVRMGMFIDRTSAEQRALDVSRIGMRPVIITE
ncbi:MAG: septal ring lytic transglycosylase RlpA family protein [Deltaproteobacteria bacterium]|nr:septal ring lytic transglycosylase RlpA family protein [Deltaproteobacteria bacterium]